MLRRYRPELFGRMGLPVLVSALAATAAATLLNMLHLPWRQSRPLDGARPAEIRAADGAVLKGSWLAGSERCVLFLHSAGGAWAHWRRERGCARLYGLGESMGASVLIEAAALEPAFAAIVGFRVRGPAG